MKSLNVFLTFLKNVYAYLASEEVRVIFNKPNTSSEPMSVNKAVNLVETKEEIESLYVAVPEGSEQEKVLLKKLADLREKGKLGTIFKSLKERSPQKRGLFLLSGLG